MRTTINIDDVLFSKASQLSGIKEKTKVVKEALNALIARESARRLALLGGTQPNIKDIPRRKSAIHK